MTLIYSSNHGRILLLSDNSAHFLKFTTLAECTAVNYLTSLCYYKKNPYQHCPDKVEGSIKGEEMKDKIIALLGGLAFTIFMYVLMVGMIILGG